MNLNDLSEPCLIALAQVARQYPSGKIDDWSLRYMISRAGEDAINHLISIKMASRFSVTELAVFGTTTRTRTWTVIPPVLLADIRKHVIQRLKAPPHAPQTESR